MSRLTEDQLDNWLTARLDALDRSARARRIGSALMVAPLILAFVYFIAHWLVWIGR